MKYEHGFQVAIPDYILNRIIADALKLESKDIEVHVINDFIHQSTRVKVMSRDESLPPLTEGCEPVHAGLFLKVVTDADGKQQHYEIEKIDFPGWVNRRND